MNFTPCNRLLISETPENITTIQCITTDNLESAMEALTAAQADWVSRNEFQAEAKSFIRIPDETANDLLWLGVGSGSQKQLRESSAWLSQQLPQGVYEYLTSEQLSELGLGWLLGQYRFDRYRSKPEPRVQLLMPTEDCEPLLVIANAMYLARDLINTPTCDMGPSHLSEVAQQLAAHFQAEFSETLDEQLVTAGYNTIYRVGQAAENRPRLIDICWGDSSDPKVTLVGKGVCFDTGGLDIKSPAGMRIMKKDMGGAAHALALASMIMANGLPIRLRVLIPAVENNISANAYRPGDIIKTYKGTTVEIDNTDAEGRLVLCDALHLAGEEQPELLLDFATLTGAARVAMGPDIVPFFTDNDDLALGLAEHADKVFDPIWRLPLYEGYEDDLKSPIADMSNMGKGPFGGAITAALFLKHFVPQDTSWAHFDLYGWNPSNKPTCPEGGQSMAIHAVFDYLDGRYSKD